MRQPMLILSLLALLFLGGCGRPSDAPTDSIAEEMIKGFWEDGLSTPGVKVADLSYQRVEKKGSKTLYVFKARIHTPKRPDGTEFLYYFQKKHPDEGQKSWEKGDWKMTYDLEEK